MRETYNIYLIYLFDFLLGEIATKRKAVTVARVYNSHPNQLQTHYDGCTKTVARTRHGRKRRNAIDLI